MQKIRLLCLFATLLLTGCGTTSIPAQITPVQPQACTEEAKVCPDGSAVGRTGPNCEFAPCPTEEQTTCTSSCTCPQGYRQEGETCNPECYYSTPQCLMPSMKCTTGNTCE